MDIRSFLNKEEEAQILDAIKTAESVTSGEIRLHLESTTKKSSLDRATDVFKQLKMHKTELHNGVLIYLAVEDKKFAIIGEKGINEAVPANFWDNIKDHMQSKFKLGEFTQGIVDGIKMAGEQLAHHFPHQGEDDINELSDDISIG